MVSVCAGGFQHWVDLAAVGTVDTNWGEVFDSAHIVRDLVRGFAAIIIVVRCVGQPGPALVCTSVKVQRIMMDGLNQTSCHSRQYKNSLGVGLMVTGYVRAAEANCDRQAIIAVATVIELTMLRNRACVKWSKERKNCVKGVECIKSARQVRCRKSDKN